MIPFNKPYSAGSTLRYVGRALESGKLSGNGPFADLCCKFFESSLGCKKAFLTPSCTSALEMSGLLANLAHGDEVIVPAFTFVSTANAFALLGARPVFVDVNPETLNLDVKCLAGALTSRTKAIAPVHYAGVACEMDEILKFASAHALIVIEDAAHGLMGSYKGRPLGTLGDLATLSFHETKNLSCGEGGCLLVNRPAWLERAQIVQDKGTNRASFRLGQVDKYTWVDVGSSYLLGELPAAALWANLEALDWIQSRRHAIWSQYHQDLAAWSKANGVRQPFIPDYAQHPAHLYYLILPDASSRTRFIAHVGELGVLAVFHYQALHTCPRGLELGGRHGQCPVTEDLAERLVRLPLYAELTDSELDRIISAVESFKP